VVEINYYRTNLLHSLGEETVSSTELYNAQVKGLP